MPLWSKTGKLPGQRGNSQMWAQPQRAQPAHCHVLLSLNEQEGDAEGSRRGLTGAAWCVRAWHRGTGKAQAGLSVTDGKWSGATCSAGQDQHSPGKAAQLWEQVRYPLGTGDRVECNLAVHVQRLKTTTGSSGTCCCAMESSKGCWRRTAWQQRTGGTSGHIFSCRRHRMGLLLGRGREAGTGREKLWVQMSTLYTQFLRALEIK